MTLADLVAAASGGSGGGKSGSSYGFLIILAVFGVIIYLFVLRPQRTRMRRAQQQQQEISVGARVMTASGMFGTVASVDDDAVLLEIAPGVTTRWARAAIGRVIEPDDVPGEVLGLDSPDRKDPDDGAEREH